MTAQLAGRKVDGTALLTDVVLVTDVVLAKDLTQVLMSRLRAMPLRQRSQTPSISRTIRGPGFHRNVVSKQVVSLNSNC